ncbi:hypothetical protein R3P38DRAFT_2838085 [Favolaschia claudopus]|uniref:F-box domain-containing protein n=1 Tax=Favolaschia claudopus TaxID=2862362 RepID=A0AAW0E5B5_9AGAR
MGPNLGTVSSYLDNESSHYFSGGPKAFSSSSPDTSLPPSLPTFPPELLRIVCFFLDGIEPSGRFIERTWGEEDIRVINLIPLSVTCRALRLEIRPYIFRSVYNWSRDEACWPESVWELIREVHLRDRQIRHPKAIHLSNTLLEALPRLPALTKVTLSIEQSIPASILISLSQSPQLTTLEIQGARLDGSGLILPETVFPQLDTLIISVWTITARATLRKVHRATELQNVALLLQCVSWRLRTLKVSGDLISSAFLAIAWPCLQNFTLTEHPPSPYYSAPRLVSHMPQLQELAFLYTADLARSDEGEFQPPFTIGSRDGEKLATSLSSVRLSNCTPQDPIFTQLPPNLTGVHIFAARDLYVPDLYNPNSCPELPLNPTDALAVIARISHLDLTELTLTLDYWPTPALVNDIAAAFPNLEFLELNYAEYPRYPYPDGDFPDDLCDDAMLGSLTHLPLLRHLRISLDFEEKNPDALQTTIQTTTAQWFLRRLPSLQSISFSYGNWEETGWAFIDPLVWASWATYTRGVLFSPEPWPFSQHWRPLRRPPSEESSLSSLALSEEGSLSSFTDEEDGQLPDPQLKAANEDQ